MVSAAVAAARAGAQQRDLTADYTDDADFCVHGSELDLSEF